MPDLSDFDDFQRHGRVLRRLARRALSNEHDVEDAEQATWLAALREYSGRVRDIKAWSFAVVRNQAARIVRRQALDRQHLTRLCESQNHSSPPPQQTYPAAAEEDEVRRITERLPDPYREVVSMRYFNEMSVEDIAGELARPTNTVKSQLRRAHGLIRTAMEQHRRRDEAPPAAAVAWLTLGGSQLRITTWPRAVTG